jgi:hypothetical protein
MGEAKTYRLGATFRIFFALFFIVFAVAVVSIGIGVIGEGQPYGVFFVAWMVLLFAIWIYLASRGVTSITLEDDTITFTSLLRTRRVPISALVAIGTDWWDLNRTIPFIRHRGGKIRLMGPLDGFYDLITQIKARNPSIEIKRL